MNTERIYVVMRREPNPWPVVTRPKSKLSQRLTAAAMSIENVVNLAAWVPVFRMPLVLLLSGLQFGVERMAELGRRERVEGCPMTAEELLRSLLVEVDSESQIVKFATHTDMRVVGYAVINADGDTLGQGETEIEAIADAIRRQYIATRNDLDKLHTKVRAFNLAFAGLNNPYE